MHYTTLLKNAAFITFFSLLFSTVTFAAPAEPQPAPQVLAGSWYVDNITQDSATVHFKTDIASQGSVNYCSDPADRGSCRMTSEPADFEYLSHAISLSDLISGHLYYYQLLAAYGESPVGYYPPPGAPINNWPTFRTLAAADVTPPTISNVRASAGETSAQIEWETNEDATTSVVYFREGDDRVNETSGPGGNRRLHVMTLSGLTPSIRYYYNPHSVDAAGNHAYYREVEGVDPHSWPSFTTSAPAPVPPPGDTSAPRIEQIKVTNITQTSAIVNWETRNADGSPDVSNSFVEYCRSADRATCLSVSNGDHVEKHVLTISELSPNTRYYYEIRSTDPSGNMSVYPVVGTPITDRPNFITLETPAGGGGGGIGVGAGGGGVAVGGDRTAPTISNIQVVVDTNVTITWTTDESSTSIVDFGKTLPYTFSAGSGTLVRNHLVVLAPTYLEANTLYHFRVRSTDSSGNTASSTDRTFRTRGASAPPAVSGGTSTSGGTPSEGGTPSVTSPGESEEPAVSEVQPFGETVFEPVAESSVKFPILAFLFVLFGLALMYVLARGNRQQAGL